MTGLLYPYQRQWLDDGARFKIGMFARQTGKTFTTTLEIADDCVAADLAGRRVRWIVLSRGERQAAEAMDEGVKLHLRAYGAAFEMFQSDVILEDVKFKAVELAFPHGSRITALPANPVTARGYSANVFLDEFAFHADSRAIWGALFPVISRSGLKLRITSTPNGKNNKFYELWTAKDTVWSRHEVDIYRAVADGLDRDIALLKAGLADDELWRQEFQLEFLDAAGAWLSHDIIAGCEDQDAGRADLYRGGPVVIGNDIARRNDLWVAWAAEIVGDVLVTREIATLQRASFAEQDAEIARMMGHYNVVRLVMDQTGMGEKPVEDARARYGAGRVFGIQLVGGVRLSVATVAKQRFEDRRLRIPAGDPALRADLHKIKKVNSETGLPRLVAERDGAGHADRAWACFLCCAGADPFLTNGNTGLLDFYRSQAAKLCAPEDAR